jgi:hypothetical protein
MPGASAASAALRRGSALACSIRHHEGTEISIAPRRAATLPIPSGGCRSPAPPRIPCRRILAESGAGPVGPFPANALEHLRQRTAFPRPKPRAEGLAAFAFAVLSDLDAAAARSGSVPGMSPFASPASRRHLPSSPCATAWSKDADSRSRWAVTPHRDRRGFFGREVSSPCGRRRASATGRESGERPYRNTPPPPSSHDTVPGRLPKPCSPCSCRAIPSART